MVIIILLSWKWSGRNNSRIDGILEGLNEGWEQCEEQLQNVFKERLGLGNVHIERAHCVRSKRNQDKMTKTILQTDKGSSKKRYQTKRYGHFH